MVTYVQPPTSYHYYEKLLLKKNKIIDDNQLKFNEFQELCKIKLTEAIKRYNNVRNSLDNIKLTNQQL